MGAEKIVVIAACCALAACGAEECADAHVTGDGGAPSDAWTDARTDAGIPIEPSGDLCKWTCEAAGSDERALLTGPARDPIGPVRMLAIVPATGFEHADVRSMQIHLKGFGFVGDWITDADLPATDLEAYSSIALLGSAWVALDLGVDGVVRIAAAIDAGTDVLWMGPGLPPELASRFGVTLAPDSTTSAANAPTLRFVGTGGRTVETPTFDEYFTQVELDGAKALATFEPAGIPAVTVHRGEDDWGRAVLIPFGLMHYWSESLEPDAWARAELLYDSFAMLSSRGAALIAPFPDGHASAFLVRFEDINPGGTRYNQHDLAYVDRFRRVNAQLDEWGISANLGIVARYADPAMGEEFEWDSPGAGRALLRTAIEDAMRDHGAELISHGFTHQYGTGMEDYTGVDWEFSDDATGEWVYLPWEEQRMRVLAARETLIAQFGITPRIWETPHLDGNADTYRAAAEAGFDLINEGDGHLYPNRWGYEGLINDAALNVPHTTSYVPLDEGEAARYLAAAAYHMMPRLTRIGAPFFLFYHGFVQGQEDAMMSLAGCAAACDLWTPTITEYADWWVQREGIRVSSSIEGGALRAMVSDHPSGATVVLRLPDGTRPSVVRVNGDDAQFTTQQSAGIAYVRVVLPDGAAEVEVMLGR